MTCTFCLIKPDAIERGLLGTLLAKIEAAGFDIKALHMLRLTEWHVRELYQEHIDKDFWPNLFNTMKRKHAVALVLMSDENGPYVVGDFRDLAVSIRNQFKPDSENQAKNLIHATDMESNQFREIDIFFPGFQF